MSATPIIFISHKIRNAVSICTCELCLRKACIFPMRPLSKKQRLQIIRRALRKLVCLTSYDTFKFVAQGSVGAVFEITELSSRCCSATSEIKLRVVESYDGKRVIAKIQIVTQPEEFEKEVQIQETFAPKSPIVLGHAMEKLGKYTFGVIVMEKLDCTLDAYLGQDLMAEEMAHVVLQLQSMLEFAQSKQLVHGDLALFNIGVRVSAKPELVFIDFDKSKHCKGFETLDQLRLAAECFRETRSCTTQPMQEHNLKFLIDNLVKKWFPKPVCSRINKKWFTEFQKFTSCP